MSEYTAVDIVDAIHAVRRARAEERERMLQVAEIATNLGMDQVEAMKGDKPLAWLDGYLVSAGIVPNYRRQL